MAPWIPSLNALRAFESVARHLSYRKAAEELHVTPAAVKQLVAKLEESVEIRLLERDGRGLVLTAAGAAARNPLGEGFRALAEGVGAMRRSELKQRLVITSDPSFAALWLVPRLADFRKRHPAIEVLLDSSPQIADLTRGAADLALRFAVAAEEDLVSDRLFDEALTVYCAPALAAGAPGLKRVEDLARVPLLHWDLGEFPWARATRRWNGWRHWLAAVGASQVMPNAGLGFTDYNLAIQAAIAGQGAILGSRPVLRDLVGAGLLVAPLAEVAATGLGYDLVTTRAAAARPEIESFRDWILAEAKGCQP